MLSKWKMEDAKLSRRVGTCHREHYHFEVVAEKHEIWLMTQPCVSKNITARPAGSKYCFILLAGKQILESTQFFVKEQLNTQFKKAVSY